MIPRLEGGSIGPRTESLVNWNGPMAMVPSLHKGNIYTKRKLWVWRDQKCIPLVGAVLGPILPPSRRGILTALTGKWGYFTFVQTRYHGHRSVPIS